MEAFADYLTGIENEEHRLKLKEVLLWVKHSFPNLETRIAWNQPMFTDHGTFILGFSVSKQHFAVAPEAKTMGAFSDQIAASGYSQGTQIFRIRWTDPVDYALLERIIRYNMEDKTDCRTFWRK